MRKLLLVVVALTGCARAVEPPAPWEVLCDPETAWRFRGHRESDVRLLAALARREIKAGDDIAPLIARYPECQVLRHGPWINLEISHGLAGTRVIAKNGKLVLGSIGSCGGVDEFFNTATDPEWTDYTRSYYARMAQRAAFRESVPAVVGVPSWIAGYFWPLKER